MGRRSKIILGLLVAVLIGIIATEVVRPKPINWKPSFTSFSKIPFGCYILYNELPSIFPSSKIEPVEESIFNFLTERDTTTYSNYLVINDVVSFDKQESIKILNYVTKGNSVFIAASKFYGPLADTLNIHIEKRYDFKEDTVKVSFTNKKLTGDSFVFVRGANPAYFTSVDTLKTEILGHLSFNDDSFLNTLENNLVTKPNFIKTTVGEGSIFINTLPVGFTNYYLLSDSKNYSANSFSYLSNATLYWDDYKKSGRKVITSPLRFVLKQPALKWSYYITIVGLLLFVIFKAKREQRIIPVIKPLENSSVEFARTIGSLYHQNKDYTNLNSQKINFFLAYLRNRFYLNTSVLNENFIVLLAAKSGKPVEETKTLITLILGLKNKPIHTEQDAILLSNKINNFKKPYGR